MSFESIAFQWVQIFCGFGFAFFFGKIHAKQRITGVQKAGFYIVVLALFYLTAMLQSPIYGLMGALLLCIDHHRKYSGGLLDTGSIGLLKVIGGESLIIVFCLFLFIISQYEIATALGIVGLALSFSFHTHEESRGLEGDIEFPMVMPMAGLLLWSLLGNPDVNAGLTCGVTFLVAFLIVFDVRGFYERKAEYERLIKKSMEELK